MKQAGPEKRVGIRFRCRECQMILKAALNLAGKNISCPYCEQGMKVPVRKGGLHTPTSQPVLAARKSPLGLIFAAVGVVSVVLVMAAYFLMSGPSLKEQLRTRTETMMRKIERDSGGLLDYVYFSEPNQREKVQVSLQKGNWDVPFGAPQELKLDHVEVREHQGTTRHRLSAMKKQKTPGHPEFLQLHWRYDNQVWMLDAVQVMQRTIVIEKMLTTVSDMIEIEVVQKKRSEQAARLAILLEKESREMLLRLESRRPDRFLNTLGKNREAIEEELIHFVRRCRNMEVQSGSITPHLDSGNLTWVVDYTADYLMGSETIQRRGRLLTEWTLLYDRPQLVWCENKVDHEEVVKIRARSDVPFRERAHANYDPDHILRLAFGDLRLLDVNAEQAFQALESEKIRFHLEQGIDMDQRITLVMNDAKLKEALDTMCPQFGVTYTQQPDGSFVISAKK